MSALALLLALAAPAQETAQARHLARAVDLYTEYMGRWPDSLEGLTKRPTDARYWPETGFWTGPLPAGASFREGSVLLGGASEPVQPPRGAIVPPTDRLRRFYSARVGVSLLRAAAEAHLEARGSFPSRLEDLGTIPNDPWGKPYAVQFLKDRVRISVDGARGLTLAELTPDEVAALDGAAAPVLGEETRKAIPKLLEAMRDDDFEPREEAVQKLRKIGPAVRPFALEALRHEKDPDLRRRLGLVAGFFPDRTPAWKEQLRALSTIFVRDGPQARAFATTCANNLSQLWKREYIYQAQFGGRMKLMPTETGKAFWLKLTTTKPPLIDAASAELLVCPLSGIEAKDFACTYAGPAQSVQKIDDGDIVGMCDDEGHGDHVILLHKSGDVMEVDRNGPEHEEAKKGTKR